MRLIKKNQVVIYVIALMLVVAGYLNFTTNGDLKSAVQTASSEEELEKMANIGDAQLMEQAVVTPVTNYLLSTSPYWISGKIKKGVCHHLVNDDKLTWVRRRKKQ